MGSPGDQFEDRGSPMMKFRTLPTLVEIILEDGRSGS